MSCGGSSSRPSTCKSASSKNCGIAAWPDAPCSYVRFSAFYADAEEQARRAGWPTREVRGGHLHMMVEPAAVANTLIELAS
jgi:hypothetical protein